MQTLRAFPNMPQLPPAGMLRVADAPTFAGMSPHTFARGCETGAIPVRLERIGNRLMVRAAEVSAWLAPKPTPTDLF